MNIAPQLQTAPFVARTSIAPKNWHTRRVRCRSASRRSTSCPGAGTAALAMPPRVSRQPELDSPKKDWPLGRQVFHSKTHQPVLLVLTRSCTGGSDISAYLIILLSL